jgi:S-adenosylmethionine:tRNA ribosyltransferase-isomerase
MVLDRACRKRSHRRVTELPELLDEGALLVFNDSRVRKARLLGTSIKTGAQVEFLLINKLYSGDPEMRENSGTVPGQLWRALVRRAQRRRVGSRYVFPGEREAEIIREEGEFRIVAFDRPIDDPWLDAHGHMPLPPYIKRADTPADSERYQTVYAKVTGSSAAPTAGLHFTEDILSALEKRGIETVFVTLHVGLGTFLPVRTANIEDHKMHEEWYTVTEEAASRIERAKAEGRKIAAVGTTSIRTLESAWDGEKKCLRRGEGATSIFIYPGYRFKVADALFTNFHTPQSTLLMLVAAFAEAVPSSIKQINTGREFILASYEEAVREGYRFFSYGDAMLIR